MGAYADSGVDINKADRIVQRIKPFIKGGNTQFAAAHPLYLTPGSKLVTSTDGVGSKTTLANLINWSEAPGILGRDLVGMVVNDIITTGAVPLHFLDYIAMNQLDEQYVVDMVATIAKACAECNMDLVGGETAEMPSHYSDPRKVDLVGFGTGFTDDFTLDGARIKPGDKLIGIRSSGPHANGYSLINKLVNNVRLPVVGNEAKWIRDALLEPTRLYFPVLSRMAGHLIDEHELPLDLFKVVRGAAHITGGGLIDNLPRMFAHNGQRAKLDYLVLTAMRNTLPIFDEIKRAAEVSEGEMYRTFNMGVGFVLCVSEKWTAEVICAFKDSGEQVYLIGEVEEKEFDDDRTVVME